MSVAQVKTNMTAENLFREVKKLPKTEFEKFVVRINRLASKENNRSKKEAELIEKAKSYQKLPPEKQKVYKKLQRKFRRDEISEEEHQTLIDLTMELEAMNVKRIECLIEVAKMRNKTLLEVIDELGLRPSAK